MLKPDYIDIDGDGNKTESMKIAAKQAEEREVRCLPVVLLKHLQKLNKF